MAESAAKNAVSTASPPSRAWLIVGTLLAIVALLAFGVYRYSFTLASSLPTSSGGLNFRPNPIQQTDPIILSAENSLNPADPSVSITNSERLPAIEPTPLPLLSPDSFQAYEGTERISILLLGIDTRCGEVGPTRTDSMMLISLDPVNLTGSALSFPRDLWVEIPDVGMHRINQAHYWGEYYALPGSGPELARRTVEQMVGMPVDHYLTVNFNAFIQFVNLIGGIEMDVPETINDPTYPDECYGYEGFFIEAGEQKLNGSTALKYARTRATDGGDIDRAERQQDVILAVRDKVMRLGMVPQLIAKSPQLWQTLQDNINTTLTDVEAIQLALLLQDIQREDIETAVIDFGSVYTRKTDDGQDVLIPRTDAVREIRDDLFPLVTAGPVSAESLYSAMQEEGARVAIYNGTRVFGLAAETQSFLIEQGIDVTEIGNADAATFNHTIVWDYGSHPNTTRYLTSSMNLPPLNVRPTDSDADEWDIMIILGEDWSASETLLQWTVVSNQ